MNHTMISDYMAHGFCFSWEPGLVWLHVASDILTGLAYYAIAMTYFYLTCHVTGSALWPWVLCDYTRYISGLNTAT